MSPLPQDPDGPVWCIVVAGGSGRRFGGAKQFERLDDERVVDRSVRVAASCCDGVVLVLPPDAMDEVADPSTITVSGGTSRSASVRNGLALVPGDAAVILVHDAARPLASAELYRRVIAAVRAGAVAAVPAVAVTDTIRDVDGGVVDRDRLRAVQTPQGFTAEALRRAHRLEPDGTDDAGLVQAAGGTVVLVEGEASNLKITDPHDMEVARLLAQLADGAHEPTDSTS